MHFKTTMEISRPFRNRTFAHAAQLLQFDKLLSLPFFYARPFALTLYQIEMLGDRRLFQMITEAQKSSFRNSFGLILSQRLNRRT